MALLGGGVGGAGNPVGGSFTGPAEALEIIGDHAYCYPGRTQCETDIQNIMDFTTGNYLFIGEVTVVAGLQPDDATDGKVSIYSLSLNGIELMMYKNDAGAHDMPTVSTAPIIIPPYTDVVLTVKSNSATTGFFTTASLTGKLQRTRD